MDLEKQLKVRVVMNNKIRVLMLGSYPLNMPHGGVETHFLQLARHIALSNDVESHIVTLGDNNKQFEKSNIQYHIIKKSSFRLFRILDMIKLRKEILKINPDLVHAQATSIIYSPVAVLIRGGYPMLLTVHGLMKESVRFERGLHRFMSKLIRIPIEKYTISKIKNIIVCSPAMESLVSNMTNSKIYVIPNGINLEDADDIQLLELNHPSILFMGVLWNVKGVDLLLNAIPFIKKSMPNIYIYIIGTGPEEENLKDIVKKLDTRENVEFLGYISEDKKYSYIKSVDGCVFPSILEPFGIVLLEAMVCGKPVVASDVGGIPYVVEKGKTGLLFECGNVEDLAEKVIFLLEDKELREKMGEAGRKRAEEFTWDKIAEQTVEEYKEILGKNRIKS